jgi:tagatose 6-phosphate kinase
MILTVTLNPAVDITYQVPSLQIGATHRVAAVTRRPGGKGVNVARVLFAIGEQVLATGLAGVGFEIGDLPADFTPVAAPVRHTVAVTDGSDATGFWEPGPSISSHEWAAFRERYAALVGRASVVVLSGSLPAGVPGDAYADLIETARLRQVPSILDTSGPALAAGLSAGPNVIKPNATELAYASDPPACTTIVISRGPAGLLAHTPTGTYTVRPPHHVSGNPTGAGDACVAALARGLRAATAWPELLADAVALSAAAVAAPAAGAFDPDLYARLRADVTVEKTR